MARMTLDELVPFLLDTPMFEDLSVSELTEVVAIAEVRDLDKGDVVFEQGEPGDAWYVVHSGSVDVFKETVRGTKRLVTLGPLSCFGEMAILDGSSRSATVQISADSRLVVFPRLGFANLLGSGSLAAYKLVYQMALVLVARQRETTSRLASLLAGQTSVAATDDLGSLVRRAMIAE